MNKNRIELKTQLVFFTHKYQNHNTKMNRGTLSYHRHISNHRVVLTRGEALLKGLFLPPVIFIVP